MRLLREDEFSDQRTQLDALLSDASTPDDSEESDFWSFRSELRNRSKATVRKWLILESWLLRWRLSQAVEPEVMQVSFISCRGGGVWTNSCEITQTATERNLISSPRC